MDPYSFGQSRRLRPSTKRCTMLIGIGNDLLVHVLEGSIHGNQNVFLPRAWYGFVLGLV